jgi:hypothetical protein
MSLSSKEAAETLSDVEQASRRSARAFGYRKASPHLILWGLIWLIGYSATDLRPADAGLIWLALVVVGCAISFFLGRKDKSAKAAGQGNGWRVLGVAAIIFVFVGATFAIFHVSGMMIGVFTPLLVGAIYAGMGLWLGLRFVVTGFAITALTLGGYFYLPEHFLLWMAFVTGGGLILAGIWFRTV